MLPSSDPLGRLFSTAGQIETLRHNQLTDNHFENLPLLKSNKLLLTSFNGSWPQCIQARREGEGANTQGPCNF